MGLTLMATGVLLFATAITAGANPGVDLAITSHVDTPDPVVGANTVRYAIVVTNLGDAASQTIYVSPYETNGESSDPPITSISGSGWTCTLSEGWSCHHAGLAAGATAATLNIRVLAPNGPTTITNHGYVSSIDTDDNPDNNGWDENTAVIADSACGSTKVSCGSGFITFARNSAVTTGSTPTLAKWLVGTTTFTGVPGAIGGQVWTMAALKSPEKLCPTNLIPLVKCTFQMNLDPIPPVYPVGNTTLVLLCHKSHCPAGILPGVGLIMVEVGANGIGLPMLPCLDGLLPVPCFTAARTAAGHLKVTVRNLSSGDPKIAGLCIRGC